MSRLREGGHRCTVLLTWLLIKQIQYQMFGNAFDAWLQISSQWSSNLCVAAARMLGSLATLQDNSTLVSLVCQAVLFPAQMPSACTATL